MRQIVTDTKANAASMMFTLVGVSVGLILLAVMFDVAPMVGYNVVTAVDIPDTVQASGTYTFSGNVSNGELVNITNGNAVYRFEFNTTANGSAATCITTNCIVVNLSEQAGTTDNPNPNTYNGSVKASGNLTATINANVSTAALLTAANTTNLTTVTADAGGTTGNSISLADNAANIVSAGLSGGVDGSSWSSASNTAITNGSELWATNSPLVSVATMIAIVAILISVLLVSLGRNSGGGGSGL